MATTSSAGNGFFASPSARPEQRTNSETAVGRDGQVVGIEAGQVPRADPLALAIEDLPPARLDVLLVAGRPLEHDEPRRRARRRRPGGPRAGSRRSASFSPARPGRSAGGHNAGRCRPAGLRPAANATRSTRCWPVVSAVGLPERPRAGVASIGRVGVAGRARSPPTTPIESTARPSARNRPMRPAADRRGPRRRVVRHPGVVDRREFTRFSVPAQIRARFRDGGRTAEPRRRSRIDSWQCARD